MEVVASLNNSSAPRLQSSPSSTDETSALGLPLRDFEPSLPPKLDWRDIKRENMPKPPIEPPLLCPRSARFTLVGPTILVELLLLSPPFSLMRPFILSPAESSALNGRACSDATSALASSSAYRCRVPENLASSTVLAPGLVGNVNISLSLNLR